uniref:Ig-like domain-containing protein n=1 Tax=Oncorhynchus mykiss TaxID=8022 RepID=A0A8K9V897_ONCMY
MKRVIGHVLYILYLWWTPMVRLSPSVTQQPSSMVVKPRESWSITCKVSGYSICDESNTTDWIRHPVDKDSLKSRFSISKNGSNNIVTLEGKRIKTEDTAVYYCRVVFVLFGICPCHAVYSYFDYWGKGTMVTVSSVSKSPSVSLLSGPIGTTQYLMCMIEDFTPNKVTVTWKKNDKEVEGQTPTVGLQPSGLYSASSLLKVNKTEWNNKVNYSCVVQHQGKPTIKTISKTGLYIGEDCTTNNVMFTFSIYII